MADELQDIRTLMADGDLEAAQAACKRFLQQNPTDAEGHELMGDILYARDLWEDAAEWYDLAIQLADSEELRIKRADANHRAKQARKGPEPTLVDDTGSSRRMIWLGVAAVAMLVVIILIGVGVARSGREEPAPTSEETASGTQPSGDRRDLTSPSPVRGTTDTPAPSRSPTQTSPIPRARENPQEHWSAPQIERRPPRRPISRSRNGTSRTSEPLTDHDQAVINAVSSLRWENDRPMTGQVNAMVDPFTGYAVIRVLVPSALPRENMVERVVRQAYRVARTALQADEVITAMTIQMVGHTESDERVMIFRGNTDRRTLARIQTAQPDFDLLWNTVFSAVRWNSLAGGEFPPGVGEDSTGNSGAR